MTEGQWVAIEKADARKRGHRPGGSPQGAGRQHVIGIELYDELAFASPKCLVKRRNMTTVAVMCDQPNPLIEPGEVGGDRNAVVGRTIVDDHNLNVDVVLDERAVDAVS